MCNPRFWPQRWFKESKRILPSLYTDVEASRKKLSGEEERRYWMKEPLFLSFQYWLLRSAGKYVKKDDGEIVLVYDRELWRLLKQLGLWERYTQNSTSTLIVLERTLRIYKDIGHLSDYSWRSSNRGSRRKLHLEVRLQNLPHLQQPAERFYEAQ